MPAWSNTRYRDQRSPRSIPITSRGWVGAEQTGAVASVSFMLPLSFYQAVFLPAGERLRLDVGSRTDLLLSDQSHGRAQFQMQVPPYYSRNTLHYGPETYIELRKV
jgi:hypothetical protein